jgi:hypothetical protein
MAVVLEEYPENKLTEEQSKEVQQAVLGEVWKCTPETGPQFKNSCANKVVAHITCANEKARSWLMEKIPHVQPWEGAVLRVGATRDIVKTTKVAMWVPTELHNVTEA